MLTVTVDCVGSGNSSTLSPLESLYSVMPSTLRTLVAFACAAGAPGFCAAAGSALATAGAASALLGGGAGTVVSGLAPPQAAANSTAGTSNLMATSIPRRLRDQNSNSTPANQVVSPTDSFFALPKPSTLPTDS